MASERDDLNIPEFNDLNVTAIAYAQGLERALALALNALHRSGALDREDLVSAYREDASAHEADRPTEGSALRNLAREMHAAMPLRDPATLAWVAQDAADANDAAG